MSSVPLHPGVVVPMRRPILLLACLAAICVAVLALGAQDGPVPTTTAAVEHARSGDLPLSFVPNRGQTDDRVRYYAQVAGLTLSFTDDRAVLALQKGSRGTALHMRFVDANPDARLEPGRRGEGVVNYLTGPRHHTGLPTYGEVAYRNLWPGIDMIFRGQGGKLKYEFHVAPGADPSQIRLAYAGADGLSLGAAGDLLIATPLGTLRDSRPVSYQPTGGRRVPVESRYALHEAVGYGFTLAARDSGRPLVIDPGLEYSTYLGQDGFPHTQLLALDPNRNAYVAGSTIGQDFQPTPGAFDSTVGGPDDMFIAKFNATGTQLLYATFLGGSIHDHATGLDVDAFGSAYVTGDTNSPDFPITAGAADPLFEGNWEGVVTKLNANGSAVDYSTFLGGSLGDFPEAVQVDAGGSAFVSGYTRSPDFPTTDGAFDRTKYDFEDVFVTKLDPAGSGLSYSTYLGGNGSDSGTSLALEGSGDIYVAGTTDSSDFPTTPGASETSHNAGDDVFITRLNSVGTALVASTYLGGPHNETAHDLDVDQADSAYVSWGAPGSGALTKLNPGLTMLSYSVYLPTIGTVQTIGTAIAVDETGHVYVTGSIFGTLPATPDAYDTSWNGAGDAFVLRLSTDGAAATYATYLGGSDTDRGYDIALDGSGAIYVTGQTFSNDFPTTPGAFASSGDDAFLTKLTTPRGFPRPKAALRVQASLVPAFAACQKSNRVHGPGLSYNSCAPPSQASDELTLGTPDSNGLPARGGGVARYDAVSGNPATPADEADVQISLVLQDVYERSDLTDYTGQVRLVTPLRITDKSEIPGMTVTDTQLVADAGCTATADPQAGASCTLITTVEALLPGAVPEGIRSVWELGQVRVDDGGADGDVASSGDNTVFMRQGVFVP